MIQAVVDAYHQTNSHGLSIAAEMADQVQLPPKWELMDLAVNQAAVDQFWDALPGHGPTDGPFPDGAVAGGAAAGAGRGVAAGGNGGGGRGRGAGRGGGRGQRGG